MVFFPGGTVKVYLPSASVATPWLLFRKTFTPARASPVTASVTLPETTGFRAFARLMKEKNISTQRAIMG
ncbi:hypothetical protein DSECCO2_532880 [anaerobic digester metagenome]